MARIGRRRLHVLGGTLCGLLALTACAASIEDAVRGAGISRDAVVRLADDRAVAARVAAPGVEVLELSNAPGGWTARLVTGSTNGPPEGSVHIVGSTADPEREWSTLAYGTAPAGVSRVVLPGLGGTGGQVVNGAWVIASEAEDVHFGQVAWEFLDATGNVRLSGEGPYPPAP